MPDELCMKSCESLAVSQWSQANRFFDACGSRAYYSAMQAARFALETRLGISTQGMTHANVQAQFNLAIHRKRLKCDPELRSQLNILMGLRDVADYGPGRLSDRRAREAIRRAQLFRSLLPKEEES